MSNIDIIVPRHGPARGIYNPMTSELLGTLGEIQTRRAASVEPTESLSRDALHWLRNERQLVPAHLAANTWWADLTPVGGPVLGPYNLRDTALQREVEWLHEHGIPYPEQAALGGIEAFRDASETGSMMMLGRDDPPTEGGN